MGSQAEVGRLLEQMAPWMQVLKEINNDRVIKADRATQRAINLQAQKDLDCISVRSHESFDSQFSDAFPAEQKELEKKIKEIKIELRNEAIFSRLENSFRILAETR